MTRRQQFRRTEGPLRESSRDGGRGISLVLAAVLPVVALAGFWVQVAGDEQDPASAEASGAPTVTVDEDDSPVPYELRTAVFVGATGVVVGGAAWLAFRMLGSHRQRLEELEGL